MQPVDIRRFQESGFERLRARERTAGALPSHRRYQYSQAAPPPLPLPAQTTAPPPDPHGPPPILCFEAEALPAQRLRSKLPPSRRADEPPEAILLNFHTSDNTLAVSRLVDSHPAKFAAAESAAVAAALADATAAAAREIGYHAAGQRPYGTTLLLRSRVRLADGAPLTADAFGVGRVLRLRADHGPPYPRHRPTHALPAADEWLLDFGGRDVKIVRPLDAPTEAWAVGAGAAASAASRLGGAHRAAALNPAHNDPNRADDDDDDEAAAAATHARWMAALAAPAKGVRFSEAEDVDPQRAAAPRAAWTEASLEERAAAMTSAMAATREGKAAAAEAARVRTDATIADAKASVAAAAWAEQRDPDELTARLADGYKARALITGGGLDEGSLHYGAGRVGGARRRARAGGAAEAGENGKLVMYGSSTDFWSGGPADEQKAWGIVGTTHGGGGVPRAVPKPPPAAAARSRPPRSPPTEPIEGYTGHQRAVAAPRTAREQLSSRGLGVPPPMMLARAAAAAPPGAAAAFAAMRTQRGQTVLQVGFRSAMPMLKAAVFVQKLWRGRMARKERAAAAPDPRDFKTAPERAQRIAAALGSARRGAAAAQLALNRAAAAAAASEQRLQYVGAGRAGWQRGALVGRAGGAAAKEAMFSRLETISRLR